MREQAVSDLIGLIYDCAIAPEKWPAALAAICDHSGSAAGTLAVFDLVAGRERTLVNHGISEENQRIYQEKYHCADLFLHPLLVREVGEPATSGDLVADEELLDSRIYREWAAPQGFRDTLMTMLTRHQGRLAFLGLTRRLDQRRYDAADRAAMRLIVPHVQRAVLISDLIEHRTVERDQLARIIDTLATATLVVEPGLRILHANEAARAMLARGRPIAAANGLIRLPRPVAAAISGMSRGRQDGRPMPDTIRVAGEAPEGDTVFVLMPLEAADGGSGQAPSRIALFIQEANGFVPLASEVWARLFGLTGGELRVLQGIVEGAAPTEIAATYGIAESTVRTHLASLFRKTGTRRQPELVRAAMSAVPPVRTA